MLLNYYAVFAWMKKNACCLSLAAIYAFAKLARKDYHYQIKNVLFVDKYIRKRRRCFSELGFSTKRINNKARSQPISAFSPSPSGRGIKGEGVG